MKISSVEENVVNVLAPDFLFIMKGLIIVDIQIITLVLIILSSTVQ